ncbi:MAG: hypothetical protein P8L18_01385 [Verrucomicrobiota bacterium]|nr:hypothetical protein [Verrucomicrobiota bacterium]
MMGKKYLTAAVIALLTHISVSTRLQGQSPPADLALLGIADILAMQIIPHEDGQGIKIPAKRFSFSYDYVQATFEGYKDGTRNVSMAEMATLFPVLPVEITQSAHLIGIGYQINQRLFLDLQLSYVNQETYHISRVPGFDEFTIRSRGVGDTSVGVNYLLWNNENESLYIGGAVSIPTGDINKTGRTPRDATRDTLLPYTMQIGSGTFDFKPSIAYVKTMGKFEWTNHLRGTIRMHKNYHDYSLSHRATLKSSLMYKWLPYLYPSLKLMGHYSDNIHGQDDDLLPRPGFYPAPVTKPSLFGGRKVDLMLGLHIPIKEQHGIDIEAGLPIYQSLKGPQPGEEWRIAASYGVRF